MFCPKCGQSNPETGKFCRSCGTDLGNVANAMSGGLNSMPPMAPMMNMQPLLDKKGKTVSWESALTKLFMGLAFLVISIVLAFTNTGQRWWYWMLIPGFMFIGTGLAHLITIKKAEKGLPVYSPHTPSPEIATAQNSSLPPAEQQWAATPGSRYKTGDLVPPSVTEGTTRHLEIDKEGKTMTLPKK
jgi:hypothetical protein